MSTPSWLSRSALLLGDDAQAKLAAASVAVIGLGGVGSYTVEALARAGVGRLVLIDGDVVDDTNRNRQLGALCSTVGQPKAEVLAARVRDIAPTCRVTAVSQFFVPEAGCESWLDGCTCAVDAVDMVSAKVALAVLAQQRGLFLVSAMGCGNKLDATRFTVADIFDTAVDPLCRVMRRELRSRGVTQLRVVYSTEPPRTVPAEEGRRPTTGSVSYVPGVAGLILAGEIIRHIINS